MTFLPIVERELRVRARLKSTYQFRLVAALGAILLAGFLLLAVQATSAAGGTGELMFKILAWASFLYCLTDGARNTADCLSSEKRAGTLGLLFLTDLRGYDVVLGKLMATSLNSIYGLLAIFPPLAIPLVIGGVTAGEFWRLVFLLLNTLFFALTLGMLVSASSRDERVAWGGTVGLTVALAGIPALLSLTSWNTSVFATLGPAAAFLNLFDRPYSAAPDQYWDAVRNTNFLSWAFLVGASFILPRAWQDRPLPSPAESARALPFGFAGNGTRVAVEKRQRLLDANPIVWLVSRGRHTAMALWILVTVAGAASLLTWRLGAGKWLLLGSMIIPFLILSMAVASEACHQFVMARDSGALELLLCTPLTTRQIVKGHVLGLRRIYLRPVVTLLSVDAGVLLLQMASLLANGKRLEALATFGLVGSQLLVSVMDLFAVAHFGMWMGLSQKTPPRAVTKTVLYVLLLPALGVCSGYLWPMIGVAKDLMFVNYAQEKMRRRFRFIVTERHGMVEEPEIVGRPSPRALRSQLPSVVQK